MIQTLKTHIVTDLSKTCNNSIYYTHSDNSQTADILKQTNFVHLLKKEEKKCPRLTLNIVEVCRLSH